jgi:hypothetical protein
MPQVSFKEAVLHLVAVQLGLLLCPTLPAAVTFTATPTTVSNTYNGVITLQVKGLTSGETVVVQKFMDVNANGVIDAGDLLVQQFQLTDGQPGMVVGGIVNPNVPGDTDSTAGQITAQLNFNGSGALQAICGKYLYRLSSPTGHFAPMTKPFGVTSFPYAQKFAGNVVIEGASTTVPDAVVVLLNGNAVALGGAVANSSGSYTIQAPPGAYYLVAFKSNYVANFQSFRRTLPALALNGGQTVTTNLAVTKATAIISGKMVDANDSSLGMPGILLSAQATNGIGGVAFTDTNGDFTMGVQSGSGPWGLTVDDTGLIVHGYLGLQEGTSANAGQTGVILAVPKATALFYGSVKDGLGNPLPGTDVSVGDSNENLYEGDGYTDANGNYAAGALGGLNGDPWKVQISSDSSPANYLFSQPAFDQDGGTNLSAGQAVLANFTALLANDRISGSLKDNNGNPIASVGVYAYATINGAQYGQGTVDTDAEGNYSLNVANGTWTVDVNSGGGDRLPSNYISPSQQTVVISNSDATVNFTALLQPLQMTTTSLPGGTVGVFYAQLVGASGGQPPYQWWLGGTITLPPGMDFSSEGNQAVVSGTPATPGTFSFWVSLSDNASPPNVVTQRFSLSIQGAPLQVDTSYVPNATNGVFYSQTLQASGGSAPYSWSIPYYSYGPPPGLTLANNGVLSGTPATNGTFGFYVRVTDAASNVADSPNPLLLDVLSPPLQITNLSLPSGTVGVAYSARLGAAGGQPPCNWSLTPASAGLPGGLALNSDGLISGTPTNAGTASFVVQVTDSAGATAKRPFSLVVIAPATPLQITTTSLPAATQNASYTTTLLASGGQPPYTWSLAPDSIDLPWDLTLAANGEISGTAVTTGTGYFMVRVTDAATNWVNQLLAITIASPVQADGLGQWHWRNPLPQGENLSTVVYANGLWVAAGNGVILTSTDGLNWTQDYWGPNYISGGGTSSKGVAFGNGLWVAAAVNGQTATVGGVVSSALIAMTSADGVNWTSYDTGTGLLPLSIAFGQDQWMVSGEGSNEGGAILSSPDGLHWNQVDSTTTGWLNHLQYGGGKWVDWPSLDQVHLLESSDGISWTNVPMPDGAQALNFSSGKWVAISDSSPYVSQVLTSTDAENWTTVGTVANCDFEHVVGEEGAWIAAGGNDIGVFANGTFTTTYTSHLGISDIEYAQDRCVAVGSSGNIVTSTDERTWTESQSSIVNLNQEIQFNDITYAEGRWVAVGAGISSDLIVPPTDIEDPTNVVATSTDGVNWSVAFGSHAGGLNIVRYGGGLWLAVGDDERVVTSTDGVNWVLSAAGPSLSTLAGYSSFSSLDYGAGIWVATTWNDWINTSYQLRTSTDGVNWTLQPAAPSLGGVRYLNGVWMGIGDCVYSSMDGTNWTTSYGASGAMSVTYGGGQWLANGMSINGLTWQSFYWLSTSADGTNWTMIARSDYGDLVPSDIQWHSGRWLGLSLSSAGYGDAVNVVSSTNLTNWTVHTPGFTLTSSGSVYPAGTLRMGYANGYAVLVGAAATILQSDSELQRLTALGWNSAGQFRLQLTAPLGGNYQIQASGDLRNWEPLLSLTNVNPTTEFTDPSANSLKARFYRAMQQP